ncbi:glycosyltransferase [Candidatus Dojkabacteria bacterium]|jgi:cellulose synthase/poly-beta-1,6-N-acetylglucosamine synthase-like glycosyltransferase|nr:glycosyltransferase [Candidatus Dojkabacteria bacterium]
MNIYAKTLLKRLRQDFGDEKIDRFEEQIKRPMTDDDKINRVEIIVLKYKNPGTEKKCVNLLIDNTEHPYKLNLYDNRPNSANMSKIWNKLIKESTCDLIVIMDSDAYVSDNWLKPLVDCFLNNDNCIMAVPTAGHSSPAHVQAIPRNMGKKPVRVNDHVSGFCFMVSRKRIKQFGMFNEDFYVFGQDSEFCERIMQQEYWGIYVCPASMVMHGDLEGGGVWSFSQSTRKASSEYEFDWSLDTTYAPALVQILKLKDKQ